MWQTNLINKTGKMQIYNRISNFVTLLPRMGSNWLKTSSENPEPWIVMVPPPYLNIIIVFRDSTKKKINKISRKFVKQNGINFSHNDNFTRYWLAQPSLPQRNLLQNLNSKKTFFNLLTKGIFILYALQLRLGAFWSTMTQARGF